MRNMDDVDRAVAEAFRDAMADFDRGLPAAERDLAAKVTRSTLNRWGRQPGLEHAVLLRLDRHYAALGRPGFLDRVLNRPALPARRWRHERLDAGQIRDPRYLQLIEAGNRLDENPVEWLARTGLLAHSHIILLRGGEAISDHIGSATAVAPELRWRDIRDRADRAYAAQVFEDVVSTRELGVRLDAMSLENGDGYRSLRIRFRSSSSAAVPVVTVPHGVVNAGGYRVH